MSGSTGILVDPVWHLVQNSVFSCNGAINTLVHPFNIFTPAATLPLLRACGSTRCMVHAASPEFDAGRSEKHACQFKLSCNLDAIWNTREKRLIAASSNHSNYSSTTSHLDMAIFTSLKCTVTLCSLHLIILNWCFSGGWFAWALQCKYSILWRIATSTLSWLLSPNLNI